MWWYKKLQLQHTFVCFKLRESSNFGPDPATTPRNVTKLFLNLWQIREPLANLFLLYILKKKMFHRPANPPRNISMKK